MTRWLLVAISALSLAGCSAPSPVPTQTLETGPALAAETLLPSLQGKVVCSNYDPVSDTCESLITLSIAGTTVTTREVGLVPVTRPPQPVTLVSTGQIENGQFCVEPSGVQLDGDISIPGNMAQFIINLARDAIAERGGICASYFDAEDGFVVTTRGRDGVAFPAGNAGLTVFDRPKALRVAS